MIRNVKTLNGYIKLSNDKKKIKRIDSYNQKKSQ